MADSSRKCPNWDWSARTVGAIVGSVTAIFAYTLATILLLLTTNQPIGTTEPFTTLTGGKTVFGPIAVVWTLLDAHWIHPHVIVGPVEVSRDVLLDVSDRGQLFGILIRTLPPLLLVGAGGFTATLLRRKTSKEYGLFGGAVIAVGYTPLLLVPALLARAPVAPNASGEVEVGAMIFDAMALDGVTVHLRIIPTVFATIYYPAVFGAVGAWLSTLPSQMFAR